MWIVPYLTLLVSESRHSQWSKSPGHGDVTLDLWCVDDSPSYREGSDRKGSTGVQVGEESRRVTRQYGVYCTPRGVGYGGTSFLDLQ